jgi:hypothetical protein
LMAALRAVFISEIKTIDGAWFLCVFLHRGRIVQSLDVGAERDGTMFLKVKVYLVQNHPGTEC